MDDQAGIIIIGMCIAVAVPTFIFVVIWWVGGGYDDWIRRREKRATRENQTLYCIECAHKLDELCRPDDKDHDDPQLVCPDHGKQILGEHMDDIIYRLVKLSKVNKMVLRDLHESELNKLTCENHLKPSGIIRHGKP